MKTLRQRQESHLAGRWPEQPTNLGVPEDPHEGRGHRRVSQIARADSGPRTLRDALVHTAVWAGLLGCAGLLYPEKTGPPHDFTALKVMALLAWGVGVFAWSIRCGYAVWVGWPLVLAGGLALQYVEVTSPDVRQHDVEGHREYIEHLVSHGRLPEVQQGWETWQPPLYYIVAALWRELFPVPWFGDPFRAVQFLAAVLYLATLLAGLWMFRQTGLNHLEAAGALSLLAFLPGHVFFAARINNDVLLPFLGAGVVYATAQFLKPAFSGIGPLSTGRQSLSGASFEVSHGTRWLWWLAVLCPALLATKGSSLPLVGGALALVFWAERRRSGWRAGLWRAYCAGLPAGIWQLLWSVRTALQTGNPLYVNTTLLPDDLRVHAPVWRRLFSFDFSAFLGGAFYYDEPARQSWPTALVISLLYGEYGMGDSLFRWEGCLRWGCLGVLLVMVAGAAVSPRAELKPLWMTCLVLAFCQTLFAAIYAVQFPFACNQNMRFLAPALVSFACLFGLGLGHFWQEGNWAGRGALVVTLTAFLVGLADFYRCLLF